MYGVIGNPVSKSMGYLIHNKAFQEAGLPHVYVPLLVQNVTRFFSAFEPYLGGLSVTMPHKEAIMKSLSRIDPAAGRIGAVNTVVPDGTGWTGYNTDCSGALLALEPTWPPEGKENFNHRCRRHRKGDWPGDRGCGSASHTHLQP